jgi:uracil-DNA glycosylase family 4
MKKEIDISKVSRQLLEIDSFFAGDFAIKGPRFDFTDSSTDGPAKQLAAVAAEAAKCTKCELSTSRIKSVPSKGNPQARLVFVGEAPGADEDAQGLPFVGRAGKLLEKIIIAMGLSKEDVLVCNILKCRPPDNRPPKANEVASCIDFLKRQIEIVQPDVIVTLGANATKALLQTKKPIGELRGQFHDYKNLENAAPIKLMPTYHPSYLVRNYSADNRLRVWQDMKKVMTELGLEIPKK